MKRARACTRLLLFAVLGLPAAGCGGCQVTFPDNYWDSAIREIVTKATWQQMGPTVVASAVGTAALPGGWGGLSALCTEMAWREWLEWLFNDPCDPASAASVVGAAAPPNGWGGFSMLGSAVARGDWRVPSGQPIQLTSLFGVQDPDHPKVKKGP